MTRRTDPTGSVRAVSRREEPGGSLPEMHPVRHEPRLDPLRGREITPPVPPMEVVRALAHTEPHPPGRPEAEALPAALPAAAQSTQQPVQQPAQSEPRRAEPLLGRSQLPRRALTGALSAAVVAAIALVMVQLAGHHHAAPVASRLGSTSLHVSTTAPPPVTHTSGPPPTTLPPRISPQTASTSDVSYVTPAHSYTISLAATGSCWVGIEKAVNGGYVWMETLAAGQSATYQATGTTVVRVGAPQVLRVSIDGITVVLPPSNTQPYDLIFNPETTS